MNGRVNDELVFGLGFLIQTFGSPKLCIFILSAILSGVKANLFWEEVSGFEYDGKFTETVDFGESLSKNILLHIYQKIFQNLLKAAHIFFLTPSSTQKSTCRGVFSAKNVEFDAMFKS